MKTLSIIVPSYNEEKCVPLFYAETVKQRDELRQRGVEIEFWFIDDGSKDGTMREVRKLRESDDSVHFVSFSRNFGKEAAIYAGLTNAKGDLVVMMDADLQDPPALLPQMADDILSGEYDCVATRRVTRKDEPPVRSFFARMFYRIMNKISQTEFVDGARDFRMMTRQMVDAILQMCEYNRFSKGIFSWVGFKTKWLGYENIVRAAGETKWSFWKLFKYSLEGIMSFSTMPLSISTVLGALLSGAGFIALIVVAICMGAGVITAGWPIIMCSVFFCCGLILLCTGISGGYLSKTYLEVKKRPVFIAKEIK